MNLDTLLARGEVMHEELAREYYLTGAGLKPEPAYRAIYDRYAALADDAALETARQSGIPTLLEWVTDARVGREVAPFEERQLLWEQQATLEVAGRTIPYLRAPIELSNSPDRAFRVALDRARAVAGAAGLDELRRDRFRREHEALAHLGWDDYVAGIAVLSGIDLDALGRAADAYLEATEDVYADTLPRLVRRQLGIDAGELVRADALRLFRFERFDAAFPGATMLAVAMRQMGEMGLDAACGGRVRFDTDEREGKQPRAFCAPVRVPEEVYVVLRPQGGHADYRTFWHELGHAMHFASTAADCSFEARRLGDNSVTEGFAMLWDHVTADPGWLGRYVDLSASDVTDLTFALSVQELFMTRRYAAKLRYELEFHRGGVGDDAPDRYADLLGSATRMRYPREDALLDLDPGFYAARYLRAWQLEALLRDTLREQHDVDWYRNPRAGAAVASLMARGQADPAERLAVEVAGVPLDFDRMARQLTDALD